ncbi:MAG TPA: hypothetical protein VMQ59_07760 [Acidimicrobiales bacterium]|nr:hypothetical protein [Acidimicrobiales bacterium]
MGGVTAAEVSSTFEVCSGAAVTAGAVVVVVVGATVVGVAASPAAASYFTICDGRTTL